MEALLSSQEICEKLKISTRTLANWRKTGRIPFYQNGRVVRYENDQVSNHIQSLTVKSQDDE